MNKRKAKCWGNTETIVNTLQAFSLLQSLVDWLQRLRKVKKMTLCKSNGNFNARTPLTEPPNSTLGGGKKM